MCIRVNLEEGLRQVWLTVLPEPQIATVAEVMLQLTSRRPPLGGWDWIIDTRNPHVKATLGEIEIIAQAFNAFTHQQSYTIFISDDPRTYDRCALLSRKFRLRRHLLARSVTEAKGLLPSIMPSI